MATKLRIIILIFSLINLSCGQSISEYGSMPSSDSPITDTPPLYPLPVPDSYTFIPSINDYKYPNTSGGYFKVSQVYIYPQVHAEYVDLASDGQYLWLLINNNKNFANSYVIKRFKPDGSDVSSCTWYGDGSYYHGLSAENDSVYLKKYGYQIQIKQINFPNCVVVKTISVNPPSPDSESYAYLGYNPIFSVLNGNILLPFYSNGKTKMKSLSSTTLSFANFAEAQSIGAEKLNWDSDYFTANNLNWTVRHCETKTSTLCLWRHSPLSQTIAYAYMPKSYYPEFDPNYGNSRAMVRGTMTGEIIYAVFANEEMHLYSLDVSAF